MNKLHTSPRFWLIVAIAILQSLAVFNIIEGGQADQLINIVSLALGGVIALRTIDKQGEAKIEAAKTASSVTSVSMPASVGKVTATKTKKK
jgi:hypothetical protein